MNDQKVDKTRDLDRITKSPNRLWRVTINRGGQQDIRIFYIQLLKDHGIVSQHDH